MKLRIVAIGAGLLAMPALWAGAQAAGLLDLPPVPPEIAERLPKYCRYELDLSAEANPYATLNRATEQGDAVCPFLAAEARSVVLYTRAGAKGCDAGALAGLKVTRVETIGGRRFREESRCASAAVSGRPVAPQARGGRSYLIVSKTAPSMRFDQPGVIEGLARIGAPVAVASQGVKFNDRRPEKSGPTYLCLQMLPGAPDALAFLRQSGLPVPADAVQSDLGGEDCVKAVKRKAGRYGVLFSGAFEPPEPDPEFELGLSASEDRSPEAVRQQVNALLQAEGYVSPAGEPMVDGVERVGRLRDGAYVSLSGGAGLVALRVRALSPELCRIAFLLAKALDSDVTAQPGDRLIVKVAGDPRQQAPVTAADAADLCALIRPSFDEWQAQAPDRPADLHDREGLGVWFGRGTIPQASAASKAG